MESGDKRRLGIRIAIFCSPAIGAVLLIVIIVGLVGGVADFVYDSVTSVLTTAVSDMVGELGEDFDITTTECWRMITEANELYREQVIEQMEEYEGKIEEWYEEYRYNDYLRDHHFPDEYTVERYIYNIDFAYAFTWMTMYTDCFNGDSIPLGMDEILMFYESITRVSAEGDYSEGVWRISNNILPLNAIAELLYPSDTEMQEMFLDDYELYVDLFSYYGIGYGSYDIYNDYTGNPSDYSYEAILYSSTMSVPAYYQTDYPNVRYGTGSISACGCAPTCIAMVLSYMTGTNLTPVDIVRWTGNRYYVAGSGSSGTIFPACAEHWGYQCMNLGGNISAAIEAIQNGHPVIVSVNGYFTSGGHFMVLTGVTEDGYFIVNDPNGANVRRFGTNRFSIDLVRNHAVNYRYFY